MPKWSAVFSLSLIFLSLSPALAQPTDEMARLIAEQLQKEEVRVPAGSGATHEAQKDIAVLSLQLDETRDQYATALSLQAQGIVAGKQVTTAKAAYERVQVMLASKEGKVQQAMAAIKRERQLATDLAARYHSQLAHRGQLPL